MGKLSFGLSWPSAIIGVALVAVAAWLSLQHWRRHGARPMVLGLEVFRWVIVSLLFLTLLRPEWVSLFKPTSPPEIVVLCDSSRSMSTRDVVSGNDVLSRADWVQQQRATPPWKPLEKRYQMRVEEFSPMPTNTSAEEGTDINAATGRRVESLEKPARGGTAQRRRLESR